MVKTVHPYAIIFYITIHVYAYKWKMTNDSRALTWELVSSCVDIFVHVSDYKNRIERCIIVSCLDRGHRDGRVILMSDPLMYVVLIIGSI